MYICWCMLNDFTVEVEADFVNPVTWWLVGDGKVMVLVLEICCFGVGKVSMSFCYLSTVNGKWWRWHCKQSACNLKLTAHDFYLDWIESLTRYMRFPDPPFKRLLVHCLKYRTLYRSVFVRSVTLEISVHSNTKLKHWFYVMYWKRDFKQFLYF